MTKNNGSIRHTNVLRPSTPDHVALARAVEEKFLVICQLHRRFRGTDLVPPQHLDTDILRWRQMRVRHKQGDFRNSEEELRSVQAVADWTLKVNAELRNQKTVPTVDWGN